MGQERLEGQMQQMRGDIKKMWGKMTDDDIMLLDGQQDKFYGRLKEKYGIARDEAEKAVKKFEKNCGC